MKAKPEIFIPWFHLKRFGDRPEFNENPIRFNGRQTGKTTRLADEYIQELFTTGHIKIKDHMGMQDCHDRLFRIIHKRLRNEHPQIISMLNIRECEIVFKELDNREY